MITPKWVDIAFQEINISEIAGPDSNPKIIEYNKHTSLHAISDEVPWCSSFMCWVMETSGIRGTNSASAKSWVNWGEALDKPKFGCVVVLSRGEVWQGHVGLYLDEDSSFVYVLGGNQGNKVGIRFFSKQKVICYRWPKTDALSLI